MRSNCTNPFEILEWIFESCSSQSPTKIQKDMVLVPEVDNNLEFETPVAEQENDETLQKMSTSGNYSFGCHSSKKLVTAKLENFADRIDSILESVGEETNAKQFISVIKASLESKESYKTCSIKLNLKTPLNEILRLMTFGDAVTKLQETLQALGDTSNSTVYVGVTSSPRSRFANHRCLHGNVILRVVSVYSDRYVAALTECGLITETRRIAEGQTAVKIKSCENTLPGLNCEQMIKLKAIAEKYEFSVYVRIDNGKKLQTGKFVAPQTEIRDGYKFCINIRRNICKNSIRLEMF